MVYNTSSSDSCEQAGSKGSDQSSEARVRQGAREPAQRKVEEQERERREAEEQERKRREAEEREKKRRGAEEQERRAAEIAENAGTFTLEKATGQVELARMPSLSS